MSKQNLLLITDIGSTNTKAILLQREGDNYKLVAKAKVGTTVELPYADVKIGLYRVIRLLEEKQDVEILTTDSDEQNLRLRKDIGYLSTSSAGGGLQILVVGLSLNDSASSAERAAYGAGGVILDTIAVDDRRLPVERIQLIDLLRPDIILFSGGVDGGAYGSVIRMGELLKAANPQPKFGVSSRVPLIYAGNIEARDFIKMMFGEKYDLHLVDNIRPTMKDENLEPARNEIQRLFMENVMEQAPGYAELKSLIMDTIIPTPIGVIKSLETISSHLNKNIMAVDIGGATTDIFSNIFGNYYRTVSANYGMSYSISNVMASAGFDNIRRWLPSEIDDDYARDYIINKMLYPTFIPSDDVHEAIEHAAARECIRMSQIHHMLMNFQVQRIGFLDKMKSGEMSRFDETMYCEKLLSKRNFSLRDFSIIIGAGGIITGSKKGKQVILMLSDAMNVDGVTEIWRDPEFISPHLGKLSDIDPLLAESLLMRHGYEKMAISIKPSFKAGKKPKRLLTVKMKNKKGEENFYIYSETLKFIEPPEESEFVINCLKGCSLGESENPLVIKSEVPLLIDARRNNQYDFDLANESLDLYNLTSGKEDLYKIFYNFMSKKLIIEGNSRLVRSLPYNGELYVEDGDEVKAETLLGETKYEPPMLFIISIMSRFNLDRESFEEGLLVSEGEEIDNGQRIFHISPKGFLGSSITYHSYVRGIIEKINYDSGSLYVREIQDYPLKPVKVNIAEKLGIPPKELRGALKKGLNDFVRTGETLAKNMHKKNLHDMLRKESLVYASPTTGTITEIDYKRGTITLQYLKKPFKLLAGVNGKVIRTDESRTVEIGYSGTTIPGIIGFGKDDYGTLAFIEDPALNDLNSYHGHVICCPHTVDLNFLQRARDAGVTGLIIPSIHDSLLVKFLGNEIGVALTGKETIAYPIILTEGCGDFPMHWQIKEKLKETDGKEVYLDTFTQIRAGVKRPKIIISD